jgi:hypothetical protein
MVLGEVQLGPGGEVLRARSAKKGRKKERRAGIKENVAGASNRREQGALDVAGASNRKEQGALDAEDFLEVIRKKTAQCSVMTPARKAPMVAPAPRRTPREQPGLPPRAEELAEGAPATPFSMPATPAVGERESVGVVAATPFSMPATPAVREHESADTVLEELIDEFEPTLEHDLDSAFFYEAPIEEVVSGSAPRADVVDEPAECAGPVLLEPEQRALIAAEHLAAEDAPVLTFNAWLDDCADQVAAPAVELHHAVQPGAPEESNKVHEAALRLVEVMVSLPGREPELLLPARLKQVHEGALRMMHVIGRTELPAPLVKAHDAALRLADSVSQQLEARLPEPPLAPAVSRWDWAIVGTSIVLALV